MNQFIILKYPIKCKRFFAFSKGYLIKKHCLIPAMLIKLWETAPVQNKAVIPSGCSHTGGSAHWINLAVNPVRRFPDRASIPWE